MSDLIDRQAALEALCNNCDNPQAVCPHYPCKQYTSIEALPSAQPEVKPKEGRWSKSDDGYECSECEWHSLYDSPWCPWCGAKMEVLRDE